jgi:hypothetical protein
MGKRGNLIDRNGIQQFITNNTLTNSVALEIKEKQPVLRIGVFTKNSLSSDRSAHLQLKSKKKPPLALRHASKQFRHDLAIYCLQKEQKGVQMLVVKNIKKIQVPVVGKTISIPAVAAAIDSRTTTEPPSTSEKESTCILPFVHPNKHVITCSIFMWLEIHASTEEFPLFLYVRTPLVIASHNLFPRGQKDALTSHLIHAN